MHAIQTHSFARSSHLTGSQGHLHGKTQRKGEHRALEALTHQDNAIQQVLLTTHNKHKDTTMEYTLVFACP